MYVLGFTRTLASASFSRCLCARKTSANKRYPIRRSRNEVSSYSSNEVSSWIQAFGPLFKPFGK